MSGEGDGVRAHHPLRDSDGIDANIKQCAASQVGVEQASTLVTPGVKPKAGLQERYVANLAFIQPFANGFIYGQVARPDCFHQKEFFLGGKVEQFFGFFGVDGEGLFAKHGFARFERHEGMPVVLLMQGCDIYGVNIGVGDEGSVIIISVRDIILFCESISALLAATGYGVDICIGHSFKGFGKGMRNTTGGNNAPFELL